MLMLLDENHNSVPREVVAQHRRSGFLHLQPSAQGYVKGQNHAYPQLLCRFAVDVRFSGFEAFQKMRCKCQLVNEPTLFSTATIID
jgi:hypothetical protein